MDHNKTQIIKKDFTREEYNLDKVTKAIKKSSARTLKNFSQEEIDLIKKSVDNKVNELNKKEITIQEMHSIVESTLKEDYPEVAKSYENYRNYKTDFVDMLDGVFQESQRIMYLGDKENSNIDSSLVSTKRSLIFNHLNKELYKKFFLNVEEIQASKDGYVYIHDMSARRDGFNCSLFDVKNVLTGGFEMGNIWYNEPKTLDVAFDVIGDIVMAAASQQYGGFTIPEVDDILADYAMKSHSIYFEKYKSLGIGYDTAFDQATEDLKKEIRQGFQGWEYKFNTVASSRGDYPFIAATAGISEKYWASTITEIMLEVRAEGQGKGGFKKPVLFPKIVFLYDKNKHGKGKALENLFNKAIECSKRAMYPDYLSLTGDGYVPEMYKKYGKIVSPMGCIRGTERVHYYTREGTFMCSATEDVETVWNKLSDKYPAMGQTHIDDKNLLIDLRQHQVEVWDTKLDSYTKVRGMIRNIQSNWCGVKLSNGIMVEVTTDHPFETENRGVVCAGYLKSYDKILTRISPDSNEYATVEKVVMLDEEEDYAYDFITESEHFEFSGVYSHNCRAFLSPWFEVGGIEPANEEDKPLFIGRFNIGAVSLHLPMILAKANKENKDFFEILDYYLEMIRNLHKRTYEYLGELKASTNPLAFCEGGLYGGNLKHNEKIKPLLKSATASFGITALNELQQLYNGKSLVEDNKFAIKVLRYINDKVNEFKKEDKHLYALYGTPAESLSGLQVKQFRNKYGIIENVSDREYVSNSFHCHVTENINPIEKQDKERDFWNLCNGGKIQYVRYPISYNTEAIKALVTRAMELGYYEGVNLSLSYCNKCGNEELDMETCTKCGSEDLTKIDRMNGYLSYSRVNGESRLNEAKMEEIKDRKSM